MKRIYYKIMARITSKLSLFLERFSKDNNNIITWNDYYFFMAQGGWDTKEKQMLVEDDCPHSSGGACGLQMECNDCPYWKTIVEQEEMFEEVE